MIYTAAFTNHFRLRVLMLAAFVLPILNACNPKKTNERQSSLVNSTNTHKTVLQSPIVIFLDSCPQPQLLAVDNGLKLTANVKARKISSNFYLNMPVYNTEEGLPLSALLCSYCDHEGNMWFGTDGGGVSKYDGHTFVNYSTKQGLANNHVRCIFEDSKNNMWFGTYGGGVSCYDGTKITNYTTKDGLASDFIICLFQDKKGNIWVGSTIGLSKLNSGNAVDKITAFKSQFTSYASIYNQSVFSITQDKNNTLFVGTNGNIFYKNIDSIGENKLANFSHIYFDARLNDNNVQSLFVDVKGMLWIGTTTGLSILDINTLTGNKLFLKSTASDTSTTKNNIISLAPYCAIPFKEVISIIQDRKGKLWFGTKNGVIYFDGQNFGSITMKQGLASDKIKSVTEDKQGCIWFSTYGAGVNRFADNSLKFCTTEQGLISNEVTCFLNDRQNNLWIGTNNGISLLQQPLSATKNNSVKNLLALPADVKSEWETEQHFKNYQFKNGVCGNLIRNIYEDKAGNIWVGTHDYGVTKFKPTDTINSKKESTSNNLIASENYSTANGLMSNNVRAVLEDRLGNIWIVNYGGVSKISSQKISSSATKNSSTTIKKTITNYSTPQGIPDKLTYCIAEDHKGNLWFGSQSHGVYCYDGNRVDAINNGSPFKEEDFAGLKKINGKYTATFTNYTAAHGLGSDCVFRIREDKYGVIWFATYEGGLSRFDASAIGKEDAHLFLNFTTNDGLADNSVYDFVFDQNDNIIVGTNFGFSILNKFVAKGTPTPSYNQTSKQLSSLNNLSNKELKQAYLPLFKCFNKKTGYPIKDIVNDAMICDANNVVWAGCGDNKLACLNLNTITQNPTMPRVAIQQVKINEEAICWSCLQNNKTVSAENESLIAELTVYGKPLPAAQMDSIKQRFAKLEFDSVSKNYDLPKNLKLDYLHNNITFDYSAIAPAFASLTTFQNILEGYNNDWNPVTQKTSATFGNISEGTYTFKLKACSQSGVWSLPISYTFKVMPPWYRSKLAYLLYLLSLIAIVWGIIKWREYNFKEKLSFEKRISEVEMQALRAQMNPHFIFNSLHSINKYVLDNDKENASVYLSKFSKLMRMILENSREQEVTLESDLAALKLYMELEALRFQNSFDFLITLDENMDSENTLIAPLLLQPFVENAILHGIREKEKGFIKIEIKRDGGIMRCLIEDNGIGLEHLVATETGMSIKRKSFGMKITKERLKIIEQLKQVKTSIEVTDLKDAENNACGLRIELQLPYEEAF